jgi:DNA-binding beta-propeller fold protein YncE
MHSTSVLRVHRARLCARVILLPLLATLTVLMSACAAQAKPLQAAAGLATSPGFGSALVGSAPVGNGPSELALDPATHTIYVANGNNANGPNAGGNTVSVIDERHCQALDVSRCTGPWPTITVGNQPSTIAIDQTTDTVYVTDTGGNTVSVFNGATCNALVTSGCGQTPATVPVGLAPLGIYADPANHTVYIANSNNGAGSGSTTVSMLDSATCNATHLAACPAQPPPTVDVGADPNDVDVNLATHTVYVTTIGAQNGWAVLDASTCNATVQSGCGTIGRITGDPAGPNAGQVDPANDTLYTANYDNTVSAFDLRHCDASDLAGCATDTPGTVTPFPQAPFEHDLWVAVDAPLHSVYVVYQKDDSLILIDTNLCNGSHPAACAALRPPAIHTGADPESVVLDSQTQTLYTADEVDNDVSVIDAARCNAQTTSGCRQLPSAVQVPGPGGLAADPAVHTMYVTSGSSTVSMIDTSTCNAYHLSGCAATPPTVTVGSHPSAIAVDSQAHTVYVANAGTGSTGSVSVINAGTCNATDPAGCGTPATLHVPGGHPDGITVDAATSTIYVATITSKGPNLVSVFNAATCNAASTAGCGQAPVLKVGDSGGGPSNSALSLAVDQATNTIYATNVILNTVPFGGDSVSVINGATCDAANTTGCGQTPATVTAGSNPWGIAVDQATDTIYTANIADGEHPGTVSVINGASCNGSDHAGCGQTPASIAAGFGSVGMAIDLATGTVYVANIQDASVSVIDSATCNGSGIAGCSQAPPKLAVGDHPSALAVDPAVGTAYVASGTENTVSVIPLTG